MKIFKYPIILAEEQDVLLHGEDAKIIHFGFDGEQRLCVWAEVWPEEENQVPHKLFIVGTGHEFNPFEREHVLTFVTPRGLVWHLYKQNRKTRQSHETD